MNILMICLGNICRSPMAEGVLKHYLQNLNIDHLHHVDSCGFEPCHLGEKPHYKAINVAQKHGVDISNQRQRLFKVEDFDVFDKIFVMDNGNYNSVRSFARSMEDMQKVDFLYNIVKPKQNIIVPDPWGGTEADFEHSFEMIDQACKILANNLKINSL